MPSIRINLKEGRDPRVSSGLRAKRLPPFFQKVNYTLLSDFVRLGEELIPGRVKFFPHFLFMARCWDKILLKNLKSSCRMAEPVTEPERVLCPTAPCVLCPLLSHWKGDEEQRCPKSLVPVVSRAEHEVPKWEKIGVQKEICSSLKAVASFKCLFMYNKHLKITNGTF